MHDVLRHVCVRLQRCLHVSEENRAALGVILSFDFREIAFPYSNPHNHKFEVLLNYAISCVGACELGERVTINFSVAFAIHHEVMQSCVVSLCFAGVLILIGVWNRAGITSLS
jgi:hypothetical protein